MSSASFAVESEASPPARMLVCTEERHIARLLQVNLERQGKLIICVLTFHEAVDALSSTKFSLVVVDRAFTDRDELHLVDWIREQPDLLNLPIVVLGKDPADRDDFRTPLGSPPFFISVPFNPMELIPFFGK